MLCSITIVQYYYKNSYPPLNFFIPVFKTPDTCELHKG